MGKQKLIILGAGESGVGAALLGKAKGYEVFVSDKGEIKEKYRQILTAEKIQFEEGSHNESLILNGNLVVKSPGIPEKTPLIQQLKTKGTEVISEIEFAAIYSKAKFVAITGSNGKTTTTLLTYHLLKELGMNVGLAGNVGDSLAKQVIEDKYDWFVLELSSFQLDDMYKFKADVAVLLNITPDHLDRYNYEFQNYINSKFRIIQNMTSSDYFICYADDEVIAKELSKKKVAPKTLNISIKSKVDNGAFLINDKINVSLKDLKKEFSIEAESLPIQGKHNMINTMASVLAAAVLNQNEKKFVDAMKNFKNASHRLEEAGIVNGVRFINDSKATNVDSVWYALDSYKDPIIWIAGGIDKGNDYTAIESLVKEKVKTLVCMGKDNTKLLKAFDKKVAKIIDTDNINDAVTKAYEEAKEGYIVLLSPACASFDLFKNYEDRGEQFKTTVKNLKVQKEKVK
ncbi:MAG: UDP-N-acetylmuramoyl-L-alanine--D-glutamate ligase [Cytophagaceae bacterium]|nr:UDP-N-acetylmuramoyl-L-alanine--D-glutamate ligase [Cytophagaceae bacterium]